MEGYKVINLKDVRDSPHKRLSLEPIPEPLDEDDPRPIRSQERLKRHFMRASKFDMQDFFESRYDEAKLQAIVQATFVYRRKPLDETPEETCQQNWQGVMNVILPERANKKVISMIKFVHNQHDIINRNMPFMFKKVPLR